MAKIAGMLSTAKITSVNSTSTSTTHSGVAARRPSSRRVKNRCQCSPFSVSTTASLAVIGALLGLGALAVDPAAAQARDGGGAARAGRDPGQAAAGIRGCRQDRSERAAISRPLRGSTMRFFGNKWDVLLAGLLIAVAIVVILYVQR